MISNVQIGIQVYDADQKNENEPRLIQWHQNSLKSSFTINISYSDSFVQQEITEFSFIHSAISSLAFIYEV